MVNWCLKKICILNILLFWFLLLIYTLFCYSVTYINAEKYTGALFAKNDNLSGYGFAYYYW